MYNAKVHNHLSKLAVLLSGLGNKSGHPKVVIMHPITYPEDRSAWQEGWVSWDDFILEGEAKKLGRTPSGEIQWYRTSFNWPLWILFSSGSTGQLIALVCEVWVSDFRQVDPSTLKPAELRHQLTFLRAIVHRAGGMLLQAKKEFVICADLQPEDVFFYYTTT